MTAIQPRVHRHVAVDEPEHRDVRHHPAIVVAGRQRVGAEADRRRVEEQIAALFPLAGALANARLARRAAAWTPAELTAPG